MNQRKLVSKLTAAANLIKISGTTSKANWAVVKNPLAIEEVKRFMDEQDRKTKNYIRKTKINKLNWKK